MTHSTALGHSVIKCSSNIHFVHFDAIPVSYFSLQHEAKVVLGIPPVCSLSKSFNEGASLFQQQTTHNAVEDAIMSVQLYHKYMEVAVLLLHKSLVHASFAVPSE